MKKLALAVALTLSGCSGLFFYPTSILYSSPRQLNLVYETREIDDGAGPKLETWLLKSPDPRGLVVHLHGNAENMSSHIASVYWLPAAGYDVLTADYRGFGGSEGHPTISGVTDDAARIFRYASTIAAERKLPLFLFGQSVGGSVGLSVAARPEFGGRFAAIAVESPFASYRDIAREKLKTYWLTFIFGYPFLYTLPERLSPVRTINRVRAAGLLFVESVNDPVVPPKFTEDLYNAAPEPKQLWRSEAAGHTQTFRDPEWRKRLVLFFDQALPRLPAVQ